MSPKSASRMFARWFALCALAVLTLASCAKSSDPAAPIETYLQALISNQSDEISKLVCAEWENDAVIEFDSLGAVSASLDGVDCSQSGTDGNYALVACQGKIVFDYNGEQRELDLTKRTYRALKEDGEWRMCGYQ